MDNLPEFYREYGQSLAERLSVELERDVVFCFIEDIESPKELLTLINQGGVPEGAMVLVLDNFDEDVDTGGRDNWHLELDCSLSVLQAALDDAQKHKAYQDCRAAVLKSLSLMLDDAESGSLANVDIQVEQRKLPLQKVGAMSTNYHGYGLTFNWAVPLDLSG